MGKKFITSALPYVNNQPHLGNIVGCVLGGDIYARYCRKRGDEVVYICGTDEYGTATEMEAMKQGVTPMEIVTKNRALHVKIYEWLNLKFDKFGNTTCEEHTKKTQEIFMKCYENGYFQKKSISQRYCIKCEQFLADRYVSGTCAHCGYNGAHGDQCDMCSKYLRKEDLKSPMCSLCGSEPEERPTEHLYLRLDLLKDKIAACLKSRSEQWSKGARDMYNSWIKEELIPRCMTRALKHKWGVPVPLKGFEDKVFYVWFDAPIGYLTFLEQARPDWQEWIADADFVQFMGKDNVPFHSIIFPAMILASLSPASLEKVLAENSQVENFCAKVGDMHVEEGIKRTGPIDVRHHMEYPIVDVINSTGYLLFNGQKFSKSKNIGIFGLDLVTKNIGSPDLWRYYLTRRRPETGDSNFASEDFIVHVKGDLIGNIGNLFNRVLKYIELRLGGQVHVEELNELDRLFVKEVGELLNEYHLLMDKILLRAALEKITELAQKGNQYLQKHQNDKGRLSHAFSMAYSLLVLLAHVTEPFMPDSAEMMYSFCKVPTSNRVLPNEFAVISDAEISSKIGIIFEPLTEEQLGVLRAYDAASKGQDKEIIQ
ncbi:methionyl-tRNA synthetase [Pancytospora epiphaga]|nr:methionyl-tRNA synthetase [Pancytospora epiphaga]